MLWFACSLCVTMCSQNNRINIILSVIGSHFSSFSLHSIRYFLAKFCNFVTLDLLKCPSFRRCSLGYIDGFYWKSDFKLGLKGLNISLQVFKSLFPRNGLPKFPSILFFIWTLWHYLTENNKLDVFIIYSVWYIAEITKMFNSRSTRQSTYTATISCRRKSAEMTCWKNTRWLTSRYRRLQVSSTICWKS